MYKYKLSLFYSTVVLSVFACSESQPVNPEKNPSKVYTPVEQVTNLGRNEITTIPGDPDAIFDAARMANADPVSGGLLYDKWWLASTLDPQPAEPAADAVHPLYPTSVNPMTGPDVFRCKECHGWDYLGVVGAYSDSANLHYTGIKGIVNPVEPYLFNTDAEIWEFLHNGDANNSLIDHAFGKDLSDDDIYNLTKFILTVRTEATEQMSPTDFITENKIIKGDSLNGLKLFGGSTAMGGAGCADAGCHGNNGQLLALGSAIDVMANSDPWQLMHKIRFGVAGSVMTGLEELSNPDLGIQQVADVLAFAQVALAPDHVRGGRLYDNWPVETGITGISSDNPLWNLADPVLTGGSVPVGDESWRCVNCHAYYYEGNIAFYYNNLVYLKNQRSWSLEYLFTQLRDGFPAVMPDGTVQVVHDFGAHLQESDLWELAAFAIEDIVDTSIYLQPDLGTAVGDGSRPADAANGLALYEGSSGATLNAMPFDCVTCHDPQAGSVPGVDIAVLAWEMPWQFFHRVRFGIPRDPNSPAEVLTMPGLLEVNAADGESLLQNLDVVNIQRYLQNLPLTP